jgi:hypothetical protein
LPARVVGEPAIGKLSGSAHDREVGLRLGVTAFLFLDEPAHGGLVEHLTHGHRPAIVDDVEQRLAACLDLGLGRPPFYVASLISHDLVFHHESGGAL